MAVGIRPRIVPAAAIILTAGLAVLGLKALSLPGPNPNLTPAAGYFSRALSAAQSVEKPVVAGVSYDVSGGRATFNGRAVETQPLQAEILRLAYALSLARRAPVFSLEDADTEQLRREVAAIAALQDRLAERQNSPQDSSAVAESLFPVNFLNRLIDFEEARRRFLNNRTAESLTAYETAADWAGVAYQEDLGRFKDAFIAVVPEDTPEYQVPTGRVTRNSFLASIEQLQQGAAVRQKTAQKQKECLGGAILSCDIAALQAPVLAIVPGTEQKVSDALLSEILVLHHGASLGLQKPAVLLTESLCVPAAVALPLYSVRGAQDDLLLFAGEAFFVDTAQGSQAPFYRFFSEKGLPYWLYPPASTYSCPNLAAEYARVQQVLRIRALATTHPLSRYASGTAKERLLELEERIAFAADILPESLATAYLKAAEHMENSADTAAPARRTVESLKLAGQTHSYGLSGVLRHLATELTTNLGLAEKGAPIVLDARTLFYLRSGYFGLFLGHTLDKEPGVGPVLPGSASALPLRRLTELRATVPPSALARYVEYFFAIHAQPDMITQPPPWQRE